jgi:hypothetical protein
VDCRLCGFSGCTRLASVSRRSFFHCPQCELIGVPVAEHLSRDEEKRRYSHHKNQLDNVQYCRYCEGIADEICKIELKNPALLDFGSGPNFVLTRVLRQRGFQCDPYDPVYELGMDACSRVFDLIILCETIEHLRDLNEEVRLLKQMSKPGGYIFIHTQLYEAKESVPKWWYAVDETHINFFNHHSLNCLASLLQRRIFYTINKEVFVLNPPATPA